MQRLAALAQTAKRYSTMSGFNRKQLESVLKRRFFFARSFDLYGGVAGLYDYGPPGCAVQANIVDTWRKHFVLEEDMLEVDTTMLTPYEVLKTSGHVDKFADWMCKDPKSGEIFRADHVVEEVLAGRLDGTKLAKGEVLSAEDKKEYQFVLAKIDGYSGPELGELMEKYKIGNPETGSKLEPPVEFNLMFQTSIGPSGQLKGFLRPETAQGQFLNFEKLLDFNNKKMPFASAAVGKSFRNEISPRAGLLRVREFLMAEIEHFVDPEDKSHPRFGTVKDLELSFLPRDVQEAGKSEPLKMTIGEAVAKKIVDNQTLGYFLGRIYLFLMKIGIDPTKLRFRQHMANEMAHYAQDCWDGELYTSYGWIECVGCADRSAYDLTVHSRKTGENLCVRETLAEPKEIEQYECTVTKKKFGPKFRRDAPKVEKWLLAQSQVELEELEKQLAQNGKIVATIPGTSVESVEIPADLVSIAKTKKMVHVREYIPNVIEPSFGLGRIIYCLYEHSFYTRPEDAARAVLSFKPLVAPTKVLLVPLSNNAKLTPIVSEVEDLLRKAQIPFKVDASSTSIGKRYARNDELGTPFGITIDFDSVKDDSVTLRERDSTKQVRGTVKDVIAAVKAITYEGVSWAAGVKSLKPFEGQSSD